MDSSDISSFICEQLKYQKNDNHVHSYRAPEQKFFRDDVLSIREIDNVLLYI